MDIRNLNKTQKLTLSAMIIALYIVILYMTQEFSFGAYQIRIVTALYALSYLFPFLVLPLGLANLISNMLGGFGLIDMFGGCIVGSLTALMIVIMRKKNLPLFTIALPIILVPGLGVAIWLSPITGLPYFAQALSLCIGQIFPGVCGFLLIQLLKKFFVFQPAKK